MKSRQKRRSKRSKSKRSRRSTNRRRSIKNSRRSKQYIPRILPSRDTKKGNITYIPASKKFVLNQRISSHQRNIFFKNKINESLGSIASTGSPSCSSTMCSGK